MVLEKIRHSKLTKVLAIYTIILMFNMVISPTELLALTGGPSQPEVQSFEPIGTTEMVDMFSGDFVYNIPLVDVGGYPMNLSYHSGITMDQEASWVGLGWNINPGSITRNMRGIPDDFNGEMMTTKLNVKPNTTYGAKFTVGAQLVGLEFLNLEFGLGVSYNNYRGVGFEYIANVSASAGKRARGSLNLGLSAGTFSGVGVNPSVSFSSSISKTNNYNTKLGVNLGLSINSKTGLNQLSFGGSVSTTNTKTQGTTSIGGSSRISFATPTFVPNVDMSMINTNVSFSATLGGEAWSVHPYAGVTGYYSNQELTSKTVTLPAYGYMFSHNALGKHKVMYDFNREKDGSFTEHHHNLPLTNFTYDAYNVSGQGIGGMYRPVRSDIGVIHDNYSSSLGLSPIEIGAEVGLGNIVHVGANFTTSVSNTFSGKWDGEESVTSKLKFTGEKSGDEHYEPYYFKQAGEMTVENDMQFFSRVGSYNANKVNVVGSGPTHIATSSYSGGGSMASNTRTKRRIRDQYIGVLSAKEADKFAISKEIDIHEANSFEMTSSGDYLEASNIDRLDITSTMGTGSEKGDHISEITVTRPDGARYIYGVPAYNYYKKEVTFAIPAGDASAIATAEVPYAQGVDDSENNSHGLDNYFSEKVIPAYAHSYLLSYILSVDYVDSDDIPGPSDDDFGTYTKINYSKVSNYKWRAPYENARYSEGFKTLEEDDKASYIYGEKDVWYVHSIETKTHVAEFSLSERMDSYGVANTHGGGLGQQLKKLDKIQLFSKKDRMINGTNATPIKTVHFEYSYKLCPNVLNNSGDDAANNEGGKLTLEKLYFTYGNSDKGALNAYTFGYNGLTNYENGDLRGVNPDYDQKTFDRWGNYKPMYTTAGGAAADEPFNSEYPYVEQKGEIVNAANTENPEETTADQYASAWSLTKIGLPSGGEIDVQYESDDYAYVQDKKAMQMLQITGASSNENSYPGTASLEGNNYLYFDLPEAIDANTLAEAHTEIQRMVLDEDGNLPKTFYFKFLVDLLDDGEHHEFVPGYMGVEEIGIVNTAPYNKAYVKIKMVDIEDFESGGSVNPISKTAWQFSRIHTPRIAYGHPDPNETGSLEHILEAMYSPFQQIVQSLSGGFNQWMLNGHRGSDFSNTKSYIRLYSLNQFKKGGGARVKKVTIGDKWKDLTGVANYENMVYGQVYDYTTEDKDGRTISSGVASYEPIIGGDENPWRQPDFIHESRIFAPDDYYYKETPFGESFFPSPSIGYGKVTVKNLQWKDINGNNNADVTRHATGKVVNEFYTAKDYPTQVKQTGITKLKYSDESGFWESFIRFRKKEFLTASQGYAIILNDMHGKQKAQWVYQENKVEPISGVEYFYKTQGNYSEFKANKLRSEVSVISKNNTIGGGTIGIDYDFVVDMRQNKTDTKGAGVQTNLDVFLLTPVPPITLWIPMIWPSFVDDQTRFRSVVNTKVINQSGILHKTVAYDLGSTIKTENKLWDKMTGQVLLTKTTNQYDDPIYSFTYPAHWAYDRMGQVYHNTGLVFKDASIESLNHNNFVKWDELGLVLGTEVSKVWVSEISSTGMQAIDVDGVPIDENIVYDEIRILRSGRRNQASLPVGSIISKKNPRIGSQIIYDNESKVIQAEAQEYSDVWRLFCDCGFYPGNTINPVLEGIRGNWRPKKSYLYLTDRSISRETNENTNVREDGVFENFNPFWLHTGGGNDWEKDETNWTWTSEVTEYSPQGFELESKDALGRFSSAVYGYNYTLPIGVASNAKYRELGYDHFEDYDFGHCVEDHFSFKAYFDKITGQESHSGKKSLRLGPNSSIGVTKTLLPCGDTEDDEYINQYND